MADMPMRRGIPERYRQPSITRDTTITLSTTGPVERPSGAPMGGSTGDMLAAARRDPNFRGIDPDALGLLVKHATDADNAIRSWLSAHHPPPGVSATGYAQAAEVGGWAGTQLSMLTRRRNYALTHPDTGGGVTMPPPAGLLGKTGSGVG